ncbi:9237_t:CDS:2 [Acaulospora colombiana]|uniref:9237_t:CDS:1 n=1 Tax=Acaulospora colombiana TaxID=27376 RepID=A0ACA9NJV2_9GLOM|nr:9237_t:CDS:2 [Acaulospora colombiana]
MCGLLFPPLPECVFNPVGTWTEESGDDDTRDAASDETKTRQRSQRVVMKQVQKIISAVLRVHIQNQPIVDQDEGLNLDSCSVYRESRAQELCTSCIQLIAISSSIYQLHMDYHRVAISPPSTLSLQQY